MVLTICFAVLTGVRVVKDSFGVVGPGQAAEFDPIQHVRQLREVIRPHKMDGHPVGAAAAQTVCKVLAVLRQTAHWTEDTRRGGG